MGLYFVDIYGRKTLLEKGILFMAISWGVILISFELRLGITILFIIFRHTKIIYIYIYIYIYILLVHYYIILRIYLL